MRVLHVLDCNKNGEITGITEVVTNLYKNQSQLGHDIKLLFLHKCSAYGEHPDWYVLSRWSDFNRIVDDFAPDIVLFHSLYKLQYIVWSKFLNRKEIPYAIEMHGGSTISNQKKSFIKKKIANYLCFNSFVRNAAGVIYLNVAERDTSIFKDTKREIIIPNGCEIPFQNGRLHKVTNIRHFIFLARIDINHKGLDILVDAISRIYDQIIGKCVFDFYGYVYDDSFQRLIAPYGEILKYRGPVYGIEKQKAYEAGDIYVLTSRYEGMPMSILEALSYGLPCLITPQTNMSNVIGEDAGWVTNCDPVSIANSIITILEESDEKLAVMRKNAKEAVKPYSWENIAKLSIDQYMQLKKDV